MRILGFNIQRTTNKPKTEIVDQKVISELPRGRVSSPPKEAFSFETIKGEVKSIKPSFIREVIPIIRKLLIINEDLGLVVQDLVSLTNTGHKIKFDNSKSAEEQDKMRRHLDVASKNWSTGQPGINGLVNKLISQIWISGAISIEWVVEKDLSGIERGALVNPETIHWVMTDKTGRYKPYQQVKAGQLGSQNDFTELNTNVYKYFALNGDTEIPYGIPPFITALSSIEIQKLMKTNLKHISNQLGLIGFLELLMDKPKQQANESLSVYEARLKSLLETSKSNIAAGLHDGILAGYDEDHEFKFHSIAKEGAGAADLYDLNQRNLANGLKTAGTFMGIPGTGTETGITVIFTKMLSQLNNVQEIIAEVLRYAYTLELKLAGIEPGYLRVEFNKSTIADDLKLQQGKEIKQRVLKALRVDGIINQDQYADEMGYNQPYQEEPVVPFEQQSGNSPTQTDPEASDKKEKKKDDSDRRSRDKKKPLPKRRDRDTRTP